MMPETNRRLVLASRPDGIPGPEHFQLEDTEIGEPGAGEVLVRNVYLSVDPAQRGWVSAVANYSEPVAIGAVMRALAVGEVVRSRSDEMPEGAFVTGMLGWQDYAVVPAKALRTVDPAIAPISASSSRKFPGPGIPSGRDARTRRRLVSVIIRSPCERGSRLSS